MQAVFIQHLKVYFLSEKEQTNKINPVIPIELIKTSLICSYSSRECRHSTSSKSRAENAVIVSSTHAQ